MAADAATGEDQGGKNPVVSSRLSVVGKQPFSYQLSVNFNTPFEPSLDGVFTSGAEAHTLPGRLKAASTVSVCAVLGWRLACFLYCVSLISEETVSNLLGVADQPVVSHELQGLRAYWSEVVSPEALVQGASRQAAEQKYRQVLREIAGCTTTLSFPYPSVALNLEELQKLLAEEPSRVHEALTRLAGNVQYELTATWTDSENRDLATPVSGKEYLKRREESEARVAAIDAKLKGVASGIALDWRSRQDRRNHIWYSLMPRDGREQFVAALRSAGPSEGVRLRLSGPWPPDAFADLLTPQE